MVGRKGMNQQLHNYQEIRYLIHGLNERVSEGKESISETRC